jgi:phosphatidylserine/phosphatidylglycerophosphate/cardiolipin synthase-like enzyme
MRWVFLYFLFLNERKRMKKVSAFLLILFLILFSSSLHYAPDKTPTSPTLSVHFSPNGGCTQAIVNEQNKAKTSILMQAYSFTSAPIAKALLNAHKKVVKVEVILDKSNLTEKYSSLDILRNSGIPTRIDAAHAIAHNKVMIIDGEVVITGSFNFTRATEEKNAENLLVMRDRALAVKYIENWKMHAKHSEFHERKGK